MNFRNIELLKDITPGTCDWILQRPEFEHWRNGSTDLLWIKGNPGTGKSSLVAFVLAHLLEKAKKSTTHPKELFLSFFFHRRGADLQKTRLGIFRTLLYQIMRAVPESCGLLFEAFIEKQHLTSHKNHIEWSENELSTFLLKILSTPGLPRSVVMFVDALDEAGKDVANELIKYFYKLHKGAREQGVRLKICFSSRPYPILAGLSRIPHVMVHDHNIDGITLYIKDFLERLSPDDTVKKNNALQEMETFISAGANGVFQWARLVLEALARGDCEREPLHQLWDRIRAIPRDLNEMYKHLLTRALDEDHRAETRILFQLVRFALHPLSIHEVRDAMAFDEEYVSWETPDETHFPYLRTDAADFEIRIKVWSAGLIEVKERDETTTVQTIHQTVANFLEDKVGLQTLFDEYSSAKALEGASHNRLATTCFHYLRRNAISHIITAPQEGTRLREGRAATLPFLRYAVESCFLHASRAEYHGVSQAGLVDLLGHPGTKVNYFWPGSSFREGRVFKTWSDLHHLFFGSGPYIVTSSGFNPRNTVVEASSTLVTMAISQGLHSTLTELKKRGVDVYKPHPTVIEALVIILHILSK